MDASKAKQLVQIIRRRNGLDDAMLDRIKNDSEVVDAFRGLRENIGKALTAYVLPLYPHAARLMQMPTLPVSSDSPQIYIRNQHTSS